jgi:hypothetical protein
MMLLRPDCGRAFLGHLVSPLLHELSPLTTPIGNLLYKTATTAAPAITNAVGTSALEVPAQMSHLATFKEP